MIHAITTGYVQITEKWRKGEGQGFMRLVNTIFDKNFSDWLPIWCYVIEHPEGLIVVDTGISENANDPIYFPPYMPLLQRAARFKISKGEEIANQMIARGLNPRDVRYVILTHLHQDHDGGLHHFPDAEFIVSRREWDAARGLSGRLDGYLNHRWFDSFAPTVIDFIDESIGTFSESYPLLPDVTLVPTYGHSAGHLSVIYHQQGDKPIVFAGDMAYTDTALHNQIFDGVTIDLDIAGASMTRMRDYVQTEDALFLPSHDPESAIRLEAHLDEKVIFPA